MIASGLKSWYDLISRTKYCGLTMCSPNAARDYKQLLFNVIINFGLIVGIKGPSKAWRSRTCSGNSFPSSWNAENIFLEGCHKTPCGLIWKSCNNRSWKIKPLSMWNSIFLLSNIFFHCFKKFVCEPAIYWKLVIL